MASIKQTADIIFQKAKFLYYNRAEKAAQSKAKLQSILNSTSEKLQKFSDYPQVQELKSHIDVIIRMVRAHINGSYKGLSNRSLALLTLGLIYFITPVDLIPDFIPVIGYVDDLSVLVAVSKSLQEDIQKFMAWEKPGML